MSRKLFELLDLNQSKYVATTLALLYKLYGPHSSETDFFLAKVIKRMYGFPKHFVITNYCKDDEVDTEALDILFDQMSSYFYSFIHGQHSLRVCCLCYLWVAVHIDYMRADDRHILPMPCCGSIAHYQCANYAMNNSGTARNEHSSQCWMCFDTYRSGKKYFEPGCRLVAKPQNGYVPRPRAPPPLLQEQLLSSSDDE